MKHKFLLLYSWFIRIILFAFPDMPFIMRFRGFLYGLGMRYCGSDFQVTHDAIIHDLQNLSVGNHVFIGNHSIVMGSGSIEIEDEAMLAPHVVLISATHVSVDQSYRYGKSAKGVIQIGRGAWIAANCTVQRNSALPRNSVLAANSFLNKVFTEEDAIYGGVPAKFLKKKND